MFSKRLKLLRKKKKITQQQIADYLGISRQGYAKYENNQSEPNHKTIRKLASYFGVTTDYLLGLSNDSTTSNNLPDLTEKDKRDIAKDLEDIINNISTDGYAQFDGRSIKDLDEDDKELLIASLENSMKLVKRLVKDKFTPKNIKNNTCR